MRRAKHLMPAISTAVSKVSQLLLLSAVSYVYFGTNANEMLVGYLLISSFVQLFDSGAIAYLLVNSRMASNASAVLRVLLMQLLTVGLGLSAGLVCVFFFVGVHDPALISVLIGLSVVQLADGLSRIVRSVLLIRGEPMAFAVPEFVVAGIRTAMMLAAISTGSALFLSLSWIPSVAVLAYSWWAVARHFNEEAKDISVRFRDVLLYGFSSSISSLFSQSPVMIASLLLAPVVAAPVAVGFRLAQAAEFVPVTFGQQLLPGIKDNLPKSRRRIVMFAGLGAVVAGGLWVFRDLLAILVAFPPGTELILLILILSLPFKFANHFLISLTMAVDLLPQRTIVTASLAVVAVGLSVVVCLGIGTSLAVAVLCSLIEVALAICLYILVDTRSDALRRDQRRPAPLRLR